VHVSVNPVQWNHIVIFCDRHDGPYQKCHSKKDRT
jgi:hypothetical protein